MRGAWSRNGKHRPPRQRTIRKAGTWSGRRRGDLIVRWIGAAARRLAHRARVDPVAPVPAQPEKPVADVIVLTWAQTFGRPSRPDPLLYAGIPGVSHPALRLST